MPGPRQEEVSRRRAIESMIRTSLSDRPGRSWQGARARGSQPEQVVHTPSRNGCKRWLGRSQLGTGSGRAVVPRGAFERLSMSGWELVERPLGQPGPWISEEIVADAAFIDLCPKPVWRLLASSAPLAMM